MNLARRRDADCGFIAEEPAVRSLMRAPSTWAAAVVALVFLAGGATAQLESTNNAAATRPTTLPCERKCLSGTCKSYLNVLDCAAIEEIGCDCAGCCIAPLTAAPTAAPTISNAACNQGCLVSTCATYLDKLSCLQSSGLGAPPRRLEWDHSLEVSHHCSHRRRHPH